MTNALAHEENTTTFRARFLHTEVVSQAKLHSARSTAGNLLQILNLISHSFAVEKI